MGTVKKYKAMEWNGIEDLKTIPWLQLFDLDKGIKT